MYMENGCVCSCFDFDSKDFHKEHRSVRMKEAEHELAREELEQQQFHEAKRRSKGRRPRFPLEDPASQEIKEEKKDGKDGKDAKSEEPAPRIELANGRFAVLGRAKARHVLTELASRGKILRDVNYNSVKESYANACNPVFSRYLLASDNSSKFSAISDLLRLPACCLSLPSESDLKRSSFSRIIKDQCHSVAGHPFPGLPMPAPRPTSPAVELREFQLKRAKAFLRAGEPGKAGKALMQQPMCNGADPKVIAQLRALFPEGIDTPMPRLPDNVKAPTFTAERVLEIIKRLPKKVAPGLSGWSYELVNVCMRSETARQAVTRLFNDIASGTLPDEVADLMLASIVWPVAKLDGSPRPICGTEVWYRMTARECVKLVAKEMGVQLQPFQYAIGVPGGVATVIHKMLESLGSKATKRGLLMIDFKNAFNSMYVQSLLEALAKFPACASVLPLAHWAYKRASYCFVRGLNEVTAVIKRERGVMQGDPLGTLALCAALDGVCRKVAAVSDAVDVFGWADDLNIAVPLDLVIQIHDLVRDESKPLGLALNQSKLKYFWPHDEALAEPLLAEMQQRGIKVVRDCVDLLGAVIGLDGEKLSNALNEKIKADKQQLFERVQDEDLEFQEAFAIVVAQNINHVLGALPPQITAKAARSLDVMREDAVKAKLGLVDATPKVMEEQALPYRFGGAGLIRAHEIAPLCYFAARASAAPVLAKMVEKQGESDLAREGMKLAFEKVDSLRGRLKEEEKARLPVDQESFYSHYEKGSKKGLSQLLTRSMYERESSRLLAEAKGNQQEVARLNAVRAPKSALWLRAVAARGTRLSNAQFSYAYRYRFGLPPRPMASMPASCAKCNEDLHAHPWHHLRCNSYKASLATKRHDATTRVMLRVARDYGGSGRLEPTKICPERKERKHADLESVIAGEPFYTDTSIVDPLADSHLVSAQKVLGAADKRAKSKIAKFGEMYSSVGAKFFPMVMETTGGMQKDFALALKAFAKAGSRTGVLVPRDFISQIRSRLAVAVQRGNAAMVSVGLADADRADSR